MNWRILLPIIFFCLIWFRAEAQELPLTHFTTDSEVNALPSAMVTYVYQDKQGFIWLALFSSGLVRYDGVRMVLFDQEDGIGDAGIWQMLEDSKGYLWVASQGGLVVSEKPLADYSGGNRVQFTSSVNGTALYQEALAQNQLTMDTAGRVWVGTSGNEIIRYKLDDDSELTLSAVSTDFHEEGAAAVTSLLAGNNGGVFVALDDGDLYHISDQEKNQIYAAPKVESDLNINSMYLDDDGFIWAYRQNGEIIRFDTRTFELQHIFQSTPSNITGITTVSGDMIWATNSSSGITRINHQTGEVTGTYSRVNGLLSNNVFDVMEDREGNVWIAQSGGLSKLRYNYLAFENFSAHSNTGEMPVLPSARVNSVYVPDSGSVPCRVWAGTEGGAVCILDDGTSQFITREDGLTGNWVNGLEKDASGRLWIATTQGLNGIAFSGQEPVPGAVNISEIEIGGADALLFSVPESPPFIAAEALQIFSSEEQEKVNSAWFPGLRSLYSVVNGNVYSLDAGSGLPSSLYKAAAFDADGYLWVGTLDRGLYKSKRPVDLETLHEFSTTGQDEELFAPFWSRDTGAPTNHIEKLFWHDGVMWTGTQEGLFALDQNTAEIRRRIARDDGLLADNAVSFDLSAKTGTLWVGTNRGLAELDPSDGQVLQTITRQDGLIDNEVWLYGSVKTDSEGSVYFGTANGLSIFHPGLNRPNETPPLLQLISADVSYASEGRNDAMFEYAALSFGNVSQVRYQTRLTGYDDGWSSPTADVRLRYTNLPAYFWPKKYTLEVNAMNESGVWAEEPLFYTFFIEPVWWLKWWAFLIFFFVFGIGVFVTDRIQRARLIKKERDAARLREAELKAETATARSNAAEAQAKVLEAENERKVIELEKARELEIAYHELKSAQSRLIQSEKMASLGRLSTGIAHEIKNPLNFINNFAEVSGELVEELLAAIRADDKEEVDFLLENIKHNTMKIEEHGKRADSIVRSLMQHARGSTATFEEVNINELVREYADLAYNGKRTNIADFNAVLEKELDPEVKKLKVMPQELGQVLINIIGNSLDAVWDLAKSGKAGAGYKPTVRVKTKRREKVVEIRIADNGPGVPEQLRERIFEPFFTTKPTGEGTGLGLSISYDIITQGHNGSLVLENRSNGGAEFIIALPVS
jgi:signal transduction histidine kinase/ligand-binding sensor domain-containing protein